MEKSSDSGGPLPRIVQVMYFKELPRQAMLQNNNQQPDMQSPQQWEAQWQEFLNTLQPTQMGWGNPELTEMVPWDDAKAFLTSFEQVAEACQWPREEWVGRLLPALRGGMEQLFCRLDARDRCDYGKVKAAILRGNSVRMESKRQHFRQCCYEDGPRRVYSQLRELCRQWLKPEKHTKEQILELIIQEQLLAMLPSEVQNWVRERGPEDCIEAVALAEDFLMGHRATRTWEWPVPLPEVTGRSLEGEGSIPASAQRQFCVGVNQKSNGEIGLMASEIMSARNSSVALPPEGQEMAGTGLTGGLVDVKTEPLDEPDLDQKPLRLDIMQGNPGNAHALDGLLAPTPEMAFQHEQQEALYPQGPEDGETIPDSLLGGRILDEIKTEYDQQADSDTEDSYEPFPEESPDDASMNPGGCDLRPKVMISLREPDGEEQSVSTQRRGRKGAAKKNIKSTQKEKKHGCPQCGHRTYYLSDLLRHMKSHTPKRPFKCRECGRTFAQQETLQNHQRIHAPEGGPSSGKNTFGKRTSTRKVAKKHTCPICGHGTTTLHSLAEHMRIHTGERPYQCLDCGKLFRFKSNLCRHQRISSHYTSSAKSSKKPGKLKNNSLQQERIKMKDAFGTATNTVAEGWETTPASRLRPRKPQGQERSPAGVTGTKSYPKERKHVCPECGQRSEKLSDMIRHMRIHTGERPYKCLDCGETFRWPANLRQHQKKTSHRRRSFPTTSLAGRQLRRQGDDDASFPPQKRPRESQGEPHQPEEAAAMVKKSINCPKKKKHSCPECVYNSERLSDVVKHMRLHTGERPYSCLECGKTFRWLSNLNEHKRNPKSCQKMPVPETSLAECDVTLSDDEELINILHKKSQQRGPESKNYSVKSLKESSAARGVRATSHPRKLQGREGSALRQRSTVVVKKSRYDQRERKHECKECGQRTYYLSDLLRHMRIHTGERPYKCPECGKTFSLTSTLNSHLKIHKSKGALNSSKSFTKRIAGHAGKKKYTCSKCGHKASSLSLHLKHMRAHARDVLHTCQECGRTFTFKSNLCRHQKIHRRKRELNNKKPLAGRRETSKVPAGSEEPSQTTKENSQQGRTELKKTGSLKPEISYGVTSATLVIRDRAYESKKPQGETSVKDETESTKGAEDSTTRKEPAIRINLERFAYFKADKTSDDQSGLAFSKAAKTSDDQSGLVTSHEAHASEKSHQCSLCEKIFSLKSYLAEHQNIQIGAKPDKCHDCGNRFAWKEKLSRHQLIHTGVKMYSCSKCGKDFLQQDALLTHLKTHDVSLETDAPAVENAVVKGTANETGEKSYKTESL
ncbi:zinc finger protein 850-like isoform X1 [Hemicordylus capensis]|uniref:zinc finger protein 850-like isoform X1 n=1 Tax=Hemicordylus capensis TaxID=884348 RepID=UPI0023022E9B|nr:zinc finger protein 850-like isoform X1 [Hemicordylus capensis]XP_053145212.1 zinc finger protein 850-like isoform X1 [Hemicordylus capensis]XP_053145213.1 zinc finger protein 850-like isoform X1 [Hemicordylus capensis]XP_053145214.1 zinc finger protein 850-like isoform X1 [Hemicordylus capensis]